MKEQLERMFPGAVVTPYIDSNGATASVGHVSVTVRNHSGLSVYEARAAYLHFSCGPRAYAKTLWSAVQKLRWAVQKESIALGTRAARDRAARVLRVLDAAKVGEVAS